MFEQIKNMIVEDNVKSGIRPAGSPSADDHSSSSLRTSLVQEDSRDTGGNQHSMSMHNSLASNTYPPKYSDRPSQSKVQQQHSQVSKKDPPRVHPKPEGLQYHPSHHENDSSPVSSTDDILTARFSKLRVQRNKDSNGNQVEARSVQREGNADPSPTEITPPSSEGSFHMRCHSRPSSVVSSTMAKPSGPRQMYSSAKVPPPPPKIPLDSDTTVIHSILPRAPSPAYDPVKTIVPSINTKVPTLNRKRSIIGTQHGSPQSPKYYSNPQNTSHEMISPNNRSSVQPRRTCIFPDELDSCLRETNVLVIDVRSRGDFDTGHIPTKAIICVEPVSLRSGIAAEELEDSLVISPEVEQSLFERRHEFDLVVYYDQKTQSDRFLAGPPTRTGAYALRYMHDTLYEFNDYRPLRKPPLVLAGGLEAWIDLFGPQSLVRSNTMALVATPIPRKPTEKIGRPIARVPKASANSSLEIRKRRLRDQKPLDADEEQIWLEKAQNEEVNPATYQNIQSDGDVGTDGEEPPSPFIHTYEDFLRRFPEPSPVRQSMVVSLPPPPPPSGRLPPPPHSVPTVPSRPAPAVPRPTYSGVSESPTSRQPSATQQPLYTPRSISHYLKLPRTGLINFGVTCYMNATIQCLLATIPLSQFFLDNRWRSLIQKNWKGSNGILPGIFANLIRSLWTNDVQAIRPTSLRNFCARLNNEWGADRQQDAKEFFDFIIDCLHEDLNQNWDRTPLRPLSGREEMQRERMPVRKVSQIEWSRYIHRENSYISDTFAGQHASRLRCTSCHNTSTTYEAFYSISVEIPLRERKQGWDIHHCLESYCKEERLSGDEVWKCPYCKCEREATKQITITRAPQFLVLHFKRFEMRKGESAKKVHTPINFPLFGLDLGPFMVSPSTTSGREMTEAVDPATTGPFMYDAYAIMRHIGTSGNGGHYVSLVRDAARSCWRKFDDQHVTDFDPNKLKSEQKLQNEQAYLLFYGRAVAR